MAASVGKVGRRFSSSSESEDSMDDFKVIEKGEYVVEKIINKRTGPEGTFYLLKWEGYPDSDNTWEPSSNIHRELIAKFEDEFEFLKDEEKQKKKKDRKKARMNEKRVSPIELKVESVPSTSKEAKANDEAEEPDEGEDQNQKPPIQDEVNTKVYRVDRVIGATKLSDELYYIIKYKNDEEFDLLTEQECRKNCPLALIAYFEQNLCWNMNKDMKIDIKLFEYDSSSGSDSD